jgi:DegV family protein with EDD domain
MQIVGDTAADIFPEQMEGLNITLVPLTFTLDGKVYRGGVDVDSEGFYRLLEKSQDYPTTSQPSVGDFVEVYRRLAATDPDILSVHIASALSGTYNSAVAAADLVPEAKITVWDSRLVSGPLGWMLEAAARCAKLGWSKDRTLALLQELQPETYFIFTVPSLKYLIHGGRISHLKGLLATALGIKPIIGVDNSLGSLTQEGQARTMKRAIQALADHISKQYAPGSAMRMQVLHGDNPEMADTLRKILDERFVCSWMPTGSIAPVLGAHTGPGLVGAFYAPVSLYARIPRQALTGAN